MSEAPDPRRILMKRGSEWTDSDWVEVVEWLMRHESLRFAGKSIIGEAESSDAWDDFVFHPRRRSTEPLSAGCPSAAIPAVSSSGPSYSGGGRVGVFRESSADHVTHLGQLIKGYDPQVRADFVGYVRYCFRRHCLRIRASRRHQETSSLPEEAGDRLTSTAPSPEKVLEQKDERRQERADLLRLRRCVNDLEDRFRRVFECRFATPDAPYSVIASELGLKEVTARVYFFNAIHAIRRCLGLTPAGERRP